MSLNRAVFIDRDGTLIVNNGYIKDFSLVEIYDFSFEAVKLFNDAGYKVIIATNQSAIARGIATEEEVQNIHNRLKKVFKDSGALIDHFYYAPCHVDGVIQRYRRQCSDRKPGAGMLLKGESDFQLNLGHSLMIGDSVSDVLAGINGGTKTALVRTGYGKEAELILQSEGVQLDYKGDNLLEVARLICE